LPETCVGSKEQIDLVRCQPNASPNDFCEDLDSIGVESAAKDFIREQRLNHDPDRLLRHRGALLPQVVANSQRKARASAAARIRRVQAVVRVSSVCSETALRRACQMVTRDVLIRFCVWCSRLINFANQTPDASRHPISRSTRALFSDLRWPTNETPTSRV